MRLDWEWRYRADEGRRLRDVSLKIAQFLTALTSVHSRHDDNPEETDDVRSEGLAGLVHIIVGKGTGSDFEVCRPVVEYASHLGDLVSPFRILESTILGATNELPHAGGRHLIECVIVIDIVKNAAEALHRLLFVHGEDGKGEAVRVTTWGKGFYFVSTTILVLQPLQPLLGRSPFRRVLEIFLIRVRAVEVLLGRGVELVNAGLVELFESGHDELTGMAWSILDGGYTIVGGRRCERESGLTTIRVLYTLDKGAGPTCCGEELAPCSTKFRAL